MSRHKDPRPPAYYTDRDSLLSQSSSSLTRDNVPPYLINYHSSEAGPRRPQRPIASPDRDVAGGSSCYADLNTFFIVLFGAIAGVSIWLTVKSSYLVSHSPCSLIKPGCQVAFPTFHGITDWHCLAGWITEFRAAIRSTFGLCRVGFGGHLGLDSVAIQSMGQLVSIHRRVRCAHDRKTICGKVRTGPIQFLFFVSLSSVVQLEAGMDCGDCAN